MHLPQSLSLASKCDWEVSPLNLEELRTRLGSPPPVVTPAAIHLRPAGTTTPVERTVPGHVVKSHAGDTFVLDTVKGSEQWHGRRTLGAVAGLMPGTLMALANQKQVESLSIEEVAFIDTETTGLGYGVGTHVFMIGVGHVVGDAFQVRQFFLRHPGEEPAMLAALALYLSKFQALVSFNGRSFDWPLIENRFILRRVPLEPTDPIHVDLLFVARRLWKLRLESCGLSSVEQEILGVRRSHDDVPGWLIPQLYFQYLRTGEARPLKRVFYHNLHDILSLATLALHIAQVTDDPWSSDLSHPVDFFSLGKLYQNSFDFQRAIRCFESALNVGLPASLESEAILRLAMVHKRLGGWPWALPLLERLVTRSGFQRIACVELAKYYEHLARDHKQALRLTMQALRCGNEPTAPSWTGISQTELLHRRRRLLQRIDSRDASVQPEI